MTQEEVAPPWEKYPNYPPADTFWRQAGEHYLKEIWRPYYDSLLAAKQKEYLKKWNVPDVWQMFYFDPNFDKFLEDIDREDFG